VERALAGRGIELHTISAATREGTGQLMQGICARLAREKALGGATTDRVMES
jgi:hypothetical protein